jgi:hypothetical protein
MSIGDKYFLRRKDVLEGLFNRWGKDPVVCSFLHLHLKPRSILEIGCANGWRLEPLRMMLGCNCSGIDASELAIKSGNDSFPELDLKVGEAKHSIKGRYDAIILGWCLYACRREDLFKIAYETDNALIDGGHMIVYDFHPDVPYLNVCPDERWFNYKMIYGKMFEWHPCYKLIYRNLFPNPDDHSEKLSVYVFKKDRIDEG